MNTLKSIGINAWELHLSKLSCCYLFVMPYAMTAIVIN